MIKAGIIGGSGYTGGELIRLLINHSQVEIDFVYSTTRAGKPISSAHADLLGQTKLEFTGKVNLNVDVVFLCLGHGNSSKFLLENSFSNQTKIIDLSNDFRLQADSTFQGKQFVYALPSDTTHFSWRNNNVSWYKPFTHQHLGEINESLRAFGNEVGRLNFLPNRGNFPRGILATAYTKFQGSIEEAKTTYQGYYENALFTHISEEPIHLKQVVNTNNCHIHLHKHDNLLLITSAIDNLLKGASGQAVQNMNLMFEFEESKGLQLKAGVF